MGWVAPRTWITGEIVTAALLNTHVRDNELDLDRRATLQSAVVATSETTTSTTFAALTTPGPAVTVSTGIAALIVIHSGFLHNIANTACLIGIDVSGATTIAASDAFTLSGNFPSTTAAWRTSAVFAQTGLTAGSNTFTAKYRTTGGTATFLDRHLTVVPLLSA